MLRADDGGRWEMVTLTLRHRREQALRPLVDSLMDAWRGTRATRRVREPFTRHVTASARALEVTWSSRNGWHPHIHLVLRTEPWSDEEKRTLETEWLARVRGARGIAVAWSSTPAAYLAKLGAEVAGIGKRAHGEHFNAWQMAREAVRVEWRRNEAGLNVPVYFPVPEWVERWREYQRVMAGRRILELDERAKAIANRANPVPEPEKRWELPLYAEQFSELARLERVDPVVLWLAIEAVRAAPGEGMSSALEDFWSDAVVGGAYTCAPLAAE